MGACDPGGVVFRSESLVKTLIGPNGIHLPRSDDHHRNFVTRRKELGHLPDRRGRRTDTVAQLAIASRLGRNRQWIGAGEIHRRREANRMLSAPCAIHGP